MERNAARYTSFGSEWYRIPLNLTRLITTKIRRYQAKLIFVWNFTRQLSVDLQLWSPDLVEQSIVKDMGFGLRGFFEEDPLVVPHEG